MADIQAVARHLPRRLVLHGLVVLVVAGMLLGDEAFSWSRHTLVEPLVLPATATRPGDTEATAPMGEAFARVPLAMMRPEPLDTDGLPMTAPPPVAPTWRPVASVLIPPFQQQPHTLAQGETLGALAARYGVTLEALVWANNLHNGDVLATGQTLRIPRLSGVPYTVQAGDTLDGIAARFDIPAELIAAFRANHVETGEPLPVGEEIFIPGAVPPLPETLLAARGGFEGVATIAARSTGVVRSNQTNLREGPDTVYAGVARFDAGRRAGLLAKHGNWLRVDIGGTVGWLRADMLDVSAGQVAALPESNDFPPPPPTWVWPTYGAFTSGFGPRWGGFHNGIDIANSAWTPIVAARTGRVIEAGWCSGYGYCVKMSHDGGFRTIYGHLVDQPIVSVGQVVGVGETIGYMGSTYDVSGGGYSTGNHLHFTITLNGRDVNPLTFLP
jgi:murein DD-endopeptidase MepM/ murein hydrolase activator NlpD